MGVRPEAGRPAVKGWGRGCLPRARVLLCVVVLSMPRVVGAWCVGGAPPAMDADGDDLNTLQELFFGTDPNNPDTNGNGVLDSNEDSDGDGVLNKDEPSIFSIEGFVDPFANGANHNAVVIEGTNLFNGDCPGASVCIGSPSDVVFTAAGKTVPGLKPGNLINQARIYLLLTDAPPALPPHPPQL